MKKSIIKDILDKYVNIKVTKDYQKVLSISCDAHREFNKKLSPELLKSHEKLMEVHDASWLEETDAYFFEGFKLGLRIGIECMDE